MNRFSVSRCCCGGSSSGSSSSSSSISSSSSSSSSPDLSSSSNSILDISEDGSFSDVPCNLCECHEINQLELYYPGCITGVNSPVCLNIDDLEGYIWAPFSQVICQMLATPRTITLTDNQVRTFNSTDVFYPCTPPAPTCPTVITTSPRNLTFQPVIVNTNCEEYPGYSYSRIRTFNRLYNSGEVYFGETTIIYPVGTSVFICNRRFSNVRNYLSVNFTLNCLFCTGDVRVTNYCVYDPESDSNFGFSSFSGGVSMFFMGTAHEVSRWNFNSGGLITQCEKDFFYGLIELRCTFRNQPSDNPLILPDFADGCFGNPGTAASIETFQGYPDTAFGNCQSENGITIS